MGACITISIGSLTEESLEEQSLLHSFEMCNHSNQLPWLAIDSAAQRITVNYRYQISLPHRLG